MIHDGVRITLLIIVAAQTLIERRDEGFVFLGQWILLSCGSRIFLVTPSTSRTKLASFWNCFGNFPKEEKQERSFVLTNTGKGLLAIQDIITSCGCTKVEYSKEPVRQGGTLEVKVIYEAEKAEHFNKTVTVYCNTEDSPLRLTVKGSAY